MTRINSPKLLGELRDRVVSGRNSGTPCITVCSGTGCVASGAKDVVAAFNHEIEAQGLRVEVSFRATGCHGFCEKGPIVVIDPEEICYLQVTPEDVPEIMAKTIKEKEVIERLLYVDQNTGEKSVHESDIPFYRHQERMVFGANRRIDPRSFEDYLAIGGYQALTKALFEMTPDEVIAEVKEAKLRVAEAVGFPAGKKWEIARNAPGDTKYVVVNCDEGDPGAYMDRSLMEGNPYGVLEGLMIGAYAIGSHEGYVYVRQEYPLALENLEIAIEDTRTIGLLGNDILGSGFDFQVKVHRGAGAFVCGEETALLISLEGKVGEPRPRPPYPAVKGTLGQADQHQQCRDLGQCSLDYNQGSCRLRLDRHRGKQGHEDLLLGRQDRQYRSRGSADGHHPEGYHLQDRRRNPGRQKVQGGADRRTVRRLHPRRACWI